MVLWWDERWAARKADKMGSHLGVSKDVLTVGSWDAQTAFQ